MMDKEDIIKWGFFITGVVMISIFPDNISWEYSGLLLTVGTILLVYGIIFDK